MKRYKSFKTMNEPQETNEFFQPSATPINEIPLYDVPSHMQQPNVRNAIRKNQMKIPRPQEYDQHFQPHMQQPMQQQFQHHIQQQFQQQFQPHIQQPMQQQFQHHMQPLLPVHAYKEEVDVCKQMMKHLKECKKCKKKYGNKGINKYITIIIALIVIIMVLLTKVIDNM